MLLPSSVPANRLDIANYLDTIHPEHLVHSALINNTIHGASADYIDRISMVFTVFTGVERFTKYPARVFRFIIETRSSTSLSEENLATSTRPFLG